MSRQEGLTVTTPRLLKERRWVLQRNVRHLPFFGKVSALVYNALVSYVSYRIPVDILCNATETVTYLLRPAPCPRFRRLLALSTCISNWSGPTDGHSVDLQVTKCSGQAERVYKHVESSTKTFPLYPVRFLIGTPGLCQKLDSSASCHRSHFCHRCKTIDVFWKK